MNADILIDWNADIIGGDITLNGVDLGKGREFALPTAVIMSLFTWRRAGPDDNVEQGDNKFGWWGDTYPRAENHKIGSRLWLFLRSKITNETIEGVRGACEEALAWIIEDGIAQRIDVVVSRRGLDSLDFLISIYFVDGQTANLRFTDIWNAMKTA